MERQVACGDTPLPKASPLASSSLSVLPFIIRDLRQCARLAPGRRQVLDDLPAPSEMEGAGLGWLLGEFPWRHGRTIITTRSAAWEQEEEDTREVSAAEQRRCDKCGRGGLSGTMQKCGRCRLVYYCSVDCQTAAWGEHKGVCAPRRSVADVTGLSVGSFGEEEA